MEDWKFKAYILKKKNNQTPNSNQNEAQTCVKSGDGGNPEAKRTAEGNVGCGVSCNPSSWEVDVGGSGGKGHPLLIPSLRLVSVI